MLLAILLALQILGNCLMCVESIDNLGKRYDPDNEVDIDKRESEITLTDAQVNKLIDIYDKARVATFSGGNVIPDPRCSIPFDYWVQKGSYWTKESRNIYCKNDGGTDIWCAIRKKHLSTKTDWEYCLMKGAEVADPRKWKPHPDCVPLFTFYNPKFNKDMYYKGCTNINKKTPWCSHKYRHESGNGWSSCIINKVNGKWSTWTEYTSCSKTCGDGQKTRIRKCDNPPPQYGGLECKGDPKETVGCKLKECPINGNWGKWDPWGVCSKECLGGIRTRIRKCDNPEPQFGGVCLGNSTESSSCNTQPCPNDIITPPIMNLKSSLDNYRRLKFFCKIYVEQDDQFKVQKIKWKFQNTPNGPVTDLPPGCSVKNNPIIKVSTLTIHQFTKNHFGQFYCIFDNRPYYPKAEIKGVSLSISPAKVFISNKYQNISFECKLVSHGQTINGKKITWLLKRIINNKINTTKLNNHSFTMDPNGIGVSRLTLAEPNTNRLGSYGCLYDNSVGATVDVDSTEHIVYAGRGNCLGWSSHCNDEEGDCCPGLECQNGYCVPGDDIYF